MVRVHGKEELKFCTMVNGVQCVILHLVQQKLQLFVKWLGLKKCKWLETSYINAVVMISMSNYETDIYLFFFSFCVMRKAIKTRSCMLLIFTILKITIWQIDALWDVNKHKSKPMQHICEGNLLQCPVSSSPDLYCV